MTDAPAIDSSATLRVGLLCEAVEMQQRGASEALAELRSLSATIDETVRDEIRRSLVDEFKSVADELDRVLRDLRGVRRHLGLRAAIFVTATMAVGGASCAAAIRWLAPSPQRIAALRQERDSLTREVAVLDRRGGRVKLSACGPSRRLCVRIDRREPFFGAHADYAIAKGY